MEKRENIGKQVREIASVCLEGSQIAFRADHEIPSFRLVPQVLVVAHMLAEEKAKGEGEEEDHARIVASRLDVGNLGPGRWCSHPSGVCKS